MKQSIFLAAVMVYAIVATLIVNVYAPIDGSVDPPLERDPVNNNASEDAQMTVRPNDILPLNGTVVMSMEGMEDVDFRGLVPEGRAVVINNDTATVTEGVVTIEPPEATSAAEQASQQQQQEQPAQQQSSSGDESLSDIESQVEGN